VADSRRATQLAVPAPTELMMPVGRLSPLVAASQLLSETGVARTADLEGWQREAWDYYESLGEFAYGVEWFSQALSRIRLTAAEVTPGGDEPTPLETGPAAALVEQLGGGPDGAAQMMKSFGVHLAVAGDAYFVGRQVTERDIYEGTTLDALPDPDGRVWTVQPYHTIRQSRRTIKTIFGRQQRGWDMQLDETLWQPLPAEALICRVWQRHERFPWRASSPARAALPIMREIDMYNRHIMASLISRVALNGFLLIPDEVTLPANPLYQDATDPFMAEVIDLMRAAIKNPGSPIAAAPMPLQVPAALVDKFKHLTFATPVDEKIWLARDGAIKRLATTLNLPAEVLTGMGEVNHWGAWQLGEDAIKIHISPIVEIITSCLTRGYLLPMLRAAGESVTTKSGSRIIVWYDTSELTQRPDRSEMAVQLGKLGIINDTAVRRETGFDEADELSDDEQKNFLLRSLVLLGGQLAAPAYEELTGEPLGAPAVPPGGTPVTGTPPQSGGPAGGVGDVSPKEPAPQVPVTGPPKTRSEAPPPPDVSATLWRRVHGVNGVNGTHAFEIDAGRDDELTAHLPGG